MKNSYEIIFNFWAVYNPYQKFFETILGRAYWIAGSDEEKLNFLDSRVLDCQSEKRFKVPDAFQCPNREGKPVRGAIHVVEFQMRGLLVFKEIVDKVEAGQIEIVDKSGNKLSFDDVTIPDMPLCITTPVLQKLDGGYKPIVDHFDREWAEAWGDMLDGD